MAVITYLNFDLQIESAEQGYKAQVLNSPVGEAESQFIPPFSAVELDHLFAKGDATAWGTPVLFMRSSDGQLFDISAPSSQPGKEVQTIEPAEIILEPVPILTPQRAARPMLIGAALMLILIFVLFLLLSFVWSSDKKVLLVNSLSEQKQLVVLAFDPASHDPRA